MVGTPIASSGSNLLLPNVNPVVNNNNNTVIVDKKHPVAPSMASGDDFTIWKHKILRQLKNSCGVEPKEWEELIKKPKMGQISDRAHYPTTKDEKQFYKELGDSVHQKLSGVPGQFVVNADVDDAFEVYYVLYNEFGDHSDAHEEALYEECRDAKFEYDSSKKDKLEAQIGLFASDLNAKLGKCPSLIGSKLARENLVVERLQNGFPESCEEVCFYIYIF